ncbi:SPASM domain-containing protein [Candidatus Pelagibacter sp.]|nr:SPASM domain-containing protein [Candidatus Pelagibacter sp.]
MLFPSIIEYQPYSICNANCTYCPVGMLNREQKLKGHGMTNDVFNTLLDQSKGRKITRISPHLNCEPLLFQGLADQIRQWKAYHPNAVVDLSSNCVFLTTEKFLELADAGLDILELHFMGVNKEYHEMAMKTNFEKVKNNIENVLEIKRKKKLKIKLNLFSHRLKGASLNDWNNFAINYQDKGAEISFGPLWNRAGWYGKDFDKKRKGLILKKKAHPCPKPWQQIAVEHDGEVILCSLDYKKVVKIGNILKQPIEEIWNNEVMKRFQEGQNDQNKLDKLELCNNCIRGGRYALNENTLTKLVTKKIDNPLGKVLYKGYLGLLNLI